MLDAAFFVSGLSVGASLAARFQTRIKSIFTTEGTEITGKNLLFLGDLCALCGYICLLTPLIAPPATLLRMGLS
jgi:hypothetical protein